MITAVVVVLLIAAFALGFCVAMEWHCRGDRLTTPPPARALPRHERVRSDLY